jgi:hypothetical protein
MDGDLTVRAKARYVGESQEFNENGVEADNFVVDGVPTFGALEQQTTEGNRTIREIKGQGYFGIGSLDYKGKYILDGLVRRDGSSLFGPPMSGGQRTSGAAPRGASPRKTGSTWASSMSSSSGSR